MYKFALGFLKTINEKRNSWKTLRYWKATREKNREWRNGRQVWSHYTSNPFFYTVVFLFLFLFLFCWCFLYLLQFLTHSHLFYLQTYVCIFCCFSIFGQGDSLPVLRAETIRRIVVSFALGKRLGVAEIPPPTTSFVIVRAIIYHEMRIHCSRYSFPHPPRIPIHCLSLSLGIYNTL